MGGVEFIIQPEASGDYKGIRFVPRFWRVHGNYSTAQIITNPASIVLDNGSSLPIYGANHPSGTIRLDRYVVSKVGGHIFDVTGLYSNTQQVARYSLDFRTERRSLPVGRLKKATEVANGAAQTRYTMDVAIHEPMVPTLYHRLDTFASTSMPSPFDDIIDPIEGELGRIHRFGQSEKTFLFVGARVVREAFSFQADGTGVTFYEIEYAWRRDKGRRHWRDTGSGSNPADDIYPGPFPEFGSTQARYTLPPYQTVTVLTQVAPTQAEGGPPEGNVAALKTWFEQNAFSVDASDIEEGNRFNLPGMVP